MSAARCRRPQCSRGDTTNLARPRETPPPGGSTSVLVALPGGGAAGAPAVSEAEAAAAGTDNTEGDDACAEGSELPPLPTTLPPCPPLISARSALPSSWLMWREGLCLTVGAGPPPTQPTPPLLLLLLPGAPAAAPASIAASTVGGRSCLCAGTAPTAPPGAPTTPSPLPGEADPTEGEAVYPEKALVDAPASDVGGDGANDEDDDEEEEEEEGSVGEDRALYW